MRLEKRILQQAIAGIPRSSLIVLKILAVVLEAVLPSVAATDYLPLNVISILVNLPSRDQQDGIWSIYIHRYGLEAKQARPDETNWTGAEIKSCCRLASLLDVPLTQAAQTVVPVAAAAGDKIESLRQWASGRCLSADRTGVYSGEQERAGGRVRRFVRDPAGELIYCNPEHPV